MSRIYPFAIGLIAWMGILFLHASCGASEDGGTATEPLLVEPVVGSVSGTIIWNAASEGCWPPDTCMAVHVREASEGYPPSYTGDWPPDTCACALLTNGVAGVFGGSAPDTSMYMIEDVPLDTYIVFVERVDSLYLATNGSSGIRQVLGYYGGSTPTEIILNASTDSLTNIDITVPDTTLITTSDAK